MTSSNGTFSALLAICAGNSPVPGEFPTQRPVTRSFGVYFDLRPNKGLSKQSWGWWFETPSRPLWRHRNGFLSGTPLRNRLIHRYRLITLKYTKESHAKQTWSRGMQHKTKHIETGQESTDKSAFGMKLVSCLTMIPLNINWLTKRSHLILKSWF